MSKSCSKCGAENSEDAKYCSVCGYELPVVQKVEVAKTFQAKSVAATNANSRKPTVKNILVFVITFAIAYFGSQYLFSGNIESDMKKEAAKMNQMLPKQIDEYMIFDKVDVLENKTIQYNYTLIGTSKEEVKIDNVEKYIFPKVLDNVKTNPEMEVMRKNDVTFIYSYKDKNGVFVCDYKVKPEMYKE